MCVLKISCNKRSDFRGYARMKAEFTSTYIGFVHSGVQHILCCVFVLAFFKKDQFTLISLSMALVTSLDKVL
jgi:hypothetical protein